MSAPAAVDPKEPKLRNALAPLPATRRGYGIVLNASPKDGKILYTNGRVVVVRSLANPSESVIFTEHKAAVSAAVFSPSGFWVASGDVEGNVIIWSWPGLKVKNTFQLGKSISDLDWDADSTRIVAGGDGNQKARVISWDSGNNLGEITMHSQPIISVSYRKVRPYRIATGSEDLGVNLYEGPPFKFKTASKTHTRYPNGVRYSPDGAKFVSVGADMKVVVYDGTTAAVLKEADDKTADGHKGAIYAVSWASDSKSFLTASADKTAKIWDAETLTVKQTFTFGNDVLDQQVGALWSGDYLITVSLSGVINYLDVANPKQPKQVLYGHQTSIQSIVLDRDQGVFYTSGLTGEITQWNTATGASRWLGGKGHGGKVVSSLALTADKKYLLTFGMDDKVRRSELAKVEISADAGDLGGQPVSAAASPVDAELSVVGLAQEKLVLVKGISVVQTLPLGFVPTVVTFGVDGKQVYVGGKDKKIHIYDVSASALKPQAKTLDSHDKPITSIRFSPDGKLMASTDQEASVYIHTLPSLELKNSSGWRFHQATVKDSDWSPNSTKLITSSQDTHMILWKDFADFQPGDRVRAKDTHIDGVMFVRFWDDSTVISVGADRTIKIWNLVD